MTKLSQEELKAIRARCDAATEGPWDATGSGDEYYLYAPNFLTLQTGYDGEMGKEDAIFIAHSRTDVPVLLSHIEAQAAEIAEKDARIRELELKLQNVEDEIGWFASEALRDGGEDG